MKFVQRLRAGDAAALSALRKRVQAHLCGYFAKKSNCNPQDAEELTADVLVRVHSAVGAFDPNGGAKLTTWIFQIAHNLAVDWIRKQERLAVKSVAVGMLDETAEKNFNRVQANDWFRDQIVSEGSQTNACAKSPELAKKIQCMKRARAALSENDLGLIELRLTLSNREIADAERVPEGAIRKRYSRAVAKLRAAYEREMNL